MSKDQANADHHTPQSPIRLIQINRTATGEKQYPARGYGGGKVSIRRSERGCRPIFIARNPVQPALRVLLL
jgi:hypothetical protein